MKRSSENLDLGFQTTFFAYDFPAILEMFEMDETSKNWISGRQEWQHKFGNTIYACLFLS